MSKTRFVILHHRLTGSEHWDFMVERGDTLLTWQLACDPTCSITLPIPAKRIADHRKAYLEYEGPVSRDRGEVERIEAGACETLESSDRRWRFRLEGEHLRGEFVLAVDGAGNCSFIQGG